MWHETPLPLFERPLKSGVMSEVGTRSSEARCLPLSCDLTHDFRQFITERVDSYTYKEPTNTSVRCAHWREHSFQTWTGQLWKLQRLPGVDGVNLCSRAGSQWVGIQGDFLSNERGADTGSGSSSFFLLKDREMQALFPLRVGLRRSTGRSQGMYKPAHVYSEKLSVRKANS